MSETTPTHPWAAAWTALSPQRRTALWARVVDREPVAELAERLGRTVEDTEALVASTVLAFRREVVLGIGTGYDEECGSLVLRLVDSAGERLTRPERKALAVHADTCPACARAVGELLELDARLRDGLLQLDGPSTAGASGGAAVVAGPVVPAPRDDWEPAFETLSPERRTALVHGAAGAEPLSALASRLGTTEAAARDLAASSVVAFRQTVLRRLPVGSSEGCALVAAHRTEDLVVDAARERTLRAHAAACSDCAPAVEEILALHGSLRPRVAGMALGAEGASWLRARPRRSWVPGVERPAEPVDRRRIGIGVGLAATAVTAFALLGGLQNGEAPLDVVVAAPPAAAADAPEVPEGPEVDAPEVVVLAGARIAPTAAALERSAGTETSTGSGAVSTPAPSTPAPSAGSDQPSDPPSTGTPAPGTPTQPGPEPEPEPEPEPQSPPLDVAVDTETGSITVTVGLLGEPIVISTPPLVVNNR
ncbi:hypothetical protein [uncultured Nocardioides sp.]|uniref:hypothetical protein n=1 Tax=uncultured Nocardioides sp. TaxID=198441 RepID=UPI00261D59FC|nr:hypothetical protein [uncultured Nocardioides sp.]